MKYYGDRVYIFTSDGSQSLRTRVMEQFFWLRNISHSWLIQWMTGNKENW